MRGIGPVLGRLATRPAAAVDGQVRLSVDELCGTGGLDWV